MNELQNWVPSGFSIVLMGFLLRVGMTQLIKRLDAIIAELKELNRVSIAHEEQIKVLHESSRDHEKRIRKLEGDK